MRKSLLLSAALLSLIPLGASAQGTGPYHILKTAKIGGDGGFDYVYADADGRRLYVARGGTTARMTVFNLDTLAPVGEIPGYNAHGAAVDPKNAHGFATSNPVLMWDAKTLAVIKTIPAGGNPDGILFDPFNQRVYSLSHISPNLTAINTADGSIAGTVDVGGAPEQTVTDGKGHLYVDLEDKNQIAVVDAKTLTVTAHYDLGDKGGTPAGLAFDAKNRILFVACRSPANMVMMDADSGKILAAIPIGTGVDGATFNPQTMEAFSSQGDGTLSVIKENSPTSFTLEQTVQTMVGAKTLTLDRTTGHVLLIAAEYQPLPPPAPLPAGAAPPAGRGGRGPVRGPMVPDSFSIVEVGR